MPGATRQKGKTPFLASLAALSTLRSGSSRSGAIPLANSTQLSALARSSPTPQRQYRQWRWSAFKQHHWHRQHGQRELHSLNNTTGTENAAYGANALLSSTTGGGNTAVGFIALSNNTTGITNTALGFNAGFNVTTADNVIVIGTNVGGQNVDHSCFIGEIFGQTSSGGTAVFIDSNGRLGTVTSSRRFKEEIKPMERASEALFPLKPVTFRYKKAIDPAGTSQFGLVAEDVEKVNPDLVVRDQEGKPNSVPYSQVNAMLLNEFLKEHRKVEELNSTVATKLATIADLKSTVAQQQKGLEGLTEQLREQATQIQKVSAQLATAVLPSRTSNEQIRRKTNPRLADLRRKWSTILKAAPAPTKTAAFNNQPSRFTAWRLLFHTRNAHRSLTRSRRAW